MVICETNKHKSKSHYFPQHIIYKLARSTKRIENVCVIIYSRFLQRKWRKCFGWWSRLKIYFEHFLEIRSMSPHLNLFFEGIGVTFVSFCGIVAASGSLIVLRGREFVNCPINVLLTGLQICDIVINMILLTFFGLPFICEYVGINTAILRTPVVHYFVYYTFWTGTFSNQFVENFFIYISSPTALLDPRKLTS